MRLIDLPATTRLTFICEKTSQAQRFADAWMCVRPDVPTRFVAMNNITGGQTVIPRNIPYRDLPVFRDPVWARLERTPLVFDAIPGASPERSLRRSQTDLHDALFGADVLAYGCDPDVRGVGMFRRFLQTQMGLDHDHAPSPCVFATALDTETLRRAFGEARTTQDPEFAAVVRKSEAKQVFDFNWALNALPLFGDVLRGVWAHADGFMSKYQMLLLFVLRDAGPLTEHEIIARMRDWSGSGKWTPSEEGFGTPASRDKVLKQLRDKGLVGPHGWIKTAYGSRAQIGVTPLGVDFLNRVHPDCYDPDIGFRIRHWQETWPESRPAMERYIRTYFGKQKRFSEKRQR